MKLNVSSVRSLLKALFKYEATHDDDDLIEYAIQERIDYVKTYCNISTIPEIMNTQIIRMIIGEFLYQKYTLGGAEALGIETIALVSGITEDDTSFDFDNTNEKSGDALILESLNNLRYGNRVFLMRFRSVTPK